MVAQLETFYQTVAQICFTLLGFWLIILQTKYNEWRGKPDRQRLITNISLYFLLPGMMSLLAMLSIQTTSVWRAAFVVCSVIGVGETLLLVGSLVRHRRMPRVALVLRVFLLLAFLLLALVALLPTVFARIGLTALVIAGILLSLILLLAAILAWTFFIAPDWDLRRAV